MGAQILKWFYPEQYDMSTESFLNYTPSVRYLPVYSLPFYSAKFWYDISMGGLVRSWRKIFSIRIISYLPVL